MLRPPSCRKILNDISRSYLQKQFNKKTYKLQCSRINRNSILIRYRESQKNKWNLHMTVARLLSSSCSDGKSDSCTGKPLKWPSGTPANFKLHKGTEAVLNKQINTELKAFYYYLSMAAYFGRADVALPGCESFFMQMHHEEHEHALRFLNYVTMRGGFVNLQPVCQPTEQDWKCPLHAFKTALELEVEVSEKLVEVNAVAEKHGDLNASDFVITGFMEDQMKSVNEMGRFVAILSGIGDQALARYMFDKDLLENYVAPKFNVLRTKLPTPPLGTK